MRRIFPEDPSLALKSPQGPGTPDLTLGPDLGPKGRDTGAATMLAPGLATRVLEKELGFDPGGRKAGVQVQVPPFQVSALSAGRAGREPNIMPKQGWAYQPQQ